MPAAYPLCLPVCVYPPHVTPIVSRPLVRGAREKKDANCKVVDKVVKYRMPSMDTNHTMPLINITFKCIENTRKIGAGEEVLIFKAAEPKVEKEPAETLPRTEAKRRRRE